MTVSALLGSFPPLPKRMYFLTGPGCKVLIAGLRGTSFILWILIRFRVRHGGLIPRQCSPAKTWLPTRVQGQDVFLYVFLQSTSSLQIAWAVRAVWSALWTTPASQLKATKRILSFFRNTISQIFTAFCQRAKRFFFFFWLYFFFCLCFSRDVLTFPFSRELPEPSIYSVILIQLGTSSQGISSSP